MKLRLSRLEAIHYAVLYPPQLVWTGNRWTVINACCVQNGSGGLCTRPPHTDGPHVAHGLQGQAVQVWWEQ